jgi:molecular chaperone GrpE
VIRQLANRDLLLQILDVMDDFGRALAAVPAEQRESGWVSGTTMIERKLHGVLERAGVRPIEALGQPFDPAFHEAVASDPGSDGSTVVEVYRQGYLLGDNLLRPAMVRVGNRPVA